MGRAPRSLWHMRCRLLHPVDGQGLEQGREPRLLLGPRDAHLADAVGRTIQTRDARVDEGPVLAGIEMPPDPLAVIMDRRRGEALRTDPQSFRRQGHPDVNLALREPQLGLVDAPRLFHPGNRGIQALVAHDGSFEGQRPARKVPSLTDRSPYSRGHPKPGRAE